MTNVDSFQPLSVVVSDPTTPSSGDPVRMGGITGVALIDEGDSVANETTVEIAYNKVYNLLVDDNLSNTIAVFDPIYYHDSQTGSPATSLNNDPEGADAFFGIALDIVADDATTTIRVLHLPAPPRSVVEEFQVAGGSAGAHTVTGIAIGDRLIAVQHWTTAAAIATVADLTSEFSISAANAIDNTSGTDTTNDQLIVIYEDLTP